MQKSKIRQYVFHSVASSRNAFSHTSASRSDICAQRMQFGQHFDLSVQEYARAQQCVECVDVALHLCYGIASACLSSRHTLFLHPCLAPQNDDSKVCEVIVRGLVNGEKFVVERAVKVRGAVEGG